MFWAILAILAALIWATGNLIDKYVLTKWIRKPIVPVLIMGLFSLVIGIIIYFVHGLSELSYLNILLALVAGIFYTLEIMLYFQALKIEEVSRVIPLFRLSTPFVLILAAIFLGEIFSPIKYFGIGLLLIGVVLVSSRDIKEIRLGKAFWFMVLACILLAVYDVLLKYLLNFADYWTVFSYTRFGSFLALIPLLYYNFKDLRETIKESGKKVIGVMSISEVLNMTGILVFIIATSLGPIGLVNALLATSPFFVLILATILSIFYPKVLEEIITKKNLFMKLFAIILIFIGTFIIT